MPWCVAVPIPPSIDKTSIVYQLQPLETWLRDWRHYALHCNCKADLNLIGESCTSSQFMSIQTDTHNMAVVFCTVDVIICGAHAVDFLALTLCRCCVLLPPLCCCCVAPPHPPPNPTFHFLPLQFTNLAETKQLKNKDYATGLAG